MKKWIVVIVSVLLPHLLIAGENKVEPAKDKENAIKIFANYFFNEDEKGLNDVTSGAMNVDLKKYFWIKKTIKGDQKKPFANDQRWDGKIEILSGSREKVLAQAGRLVETEEDVFKVRVNGKMCSLILDKDLKVAGFDDVKEANQLDKGDRK